jgi:hypothetical protein
MFTTFVYKSYLNAVDYRRATQKILRMIVIETKQVKRFFIFFASQRLGEDSAR